MKRTYIICFLFVALLSFGAYKLSYINSVKNFKNDFPTISENAKTVGLISENQLQVSNLTKLVYETYNLNTGEVVSKEKNMPVALLGCNKSMVKEYYSKKDFPENVVKFEIIEFTRDRITVRATIAYDITSRFFIKLINETLVIYENDHETIYDYANVNFSLMPDETRIKLYDGIYIETEENLYNFLQNYSS